VAADRWEYHEETLGSPDNEVALERSRELVADGWQFLGVRFSEGVWLYRRRVLLCDESSSREPGADARTS
jgi:hypothetical protein